MKFIRTLIFRLIAFVLFIIVLLAAADNSEKVALTFIDFTTPLLPLSWWVLGAFVMGVFFTSILNTWTNTRLRLEKRKAGKKLEKSHRAMDEVKAEQHSVQIPE